MIAQVDANNLSQAATVHAIAWKESHRSFCAPEFIDLHTPQGSGKMDAAPALNTHEKEGSP